MLTKKKFDHVVIGGGIVGAATAYKLSQRFPDDSVAIVEKEAELSLHQTGRNSGVIHSGIYYKPDSLKAGICREGREQLVDFAQKNDISIDQRGKLILATESSELPMLDTIYARGKENRTPGIRFMEADEIREKEPCVRGLRAIWVPSAGIIDFPTTVRKLVDLMLKMNATNRLFLSEPVTAISRQEGRVVLKTGNEELSAGNVIVCGGLHSDRLAKLDGLKLDLQIVGFRGDYFELVESAREKVRHLIYPVPDPRYPFLGIHFTPMVNGAVECGPNAVFTFKREGYGKTSFDLKDSAEAFAFKGTWKLFSKNWETGLKEYRRAFSKKLFLKQAKKMIPEIRADEMFASRSGVRALAVGKDGSMIDDFVIVKNKGVTHVINAPSPAATACLAIADEIISKMDQRDS